MDYSHQMIVERLAQKIEALEDELSDHRRLFPRLSGGPDTKATTLAGRITGTWDAAEALGLDHLIEPERRRIQQLRRRVRIA